MATLNNNWAAWEQQPGRIFQGQRAGRACDWWRGRYAEDFDRAAALHQNAHRFSVEWSRIEPERGKIDRSALRFYAEMIAALRARHMEPLLTLHHFTNPLWIEEDGGWLNPQTVRRFAHFVRVVAEELGADVTLWCTVNEPMVYATQGYLFGRFPPGEAQPGPCPARRRAPVARPCRRLSCPQGGATGGADWPGQTSDQPGAAPPGLAASARRWRWCGRCSTAPSSWP
ncbi:MAG: hypothetical protein KatS3mg051_1369 [Anaerolineae bacterium]|nr:MAG: hypothetical protein KatS3mg051_1369 [Anaerolineae bacterium]